VVFLVIVGFPRNFGFSAVGSRVLRAGFAGVSSRWALRGAAGELSQSTGAGARNRPDLLNPGALAAL
jgi:hypothetical protein